MKNKKVGIIGCGAIGSRIAKYIVRDLKDKLSLASLCDKEQARAISIISELKIPASVDSIDTLIKKCDIIIESASANISYSVAKKAVIQGKDILLMSVGGLFGKSDLFDLARRKNCHIYLPSGAVCGLDGIKALSMGKIKKILLTTYKPPRGLEGAPFIKRNNIRLDKIKKETIIFKGSVKEAVRYFPKNINVSAILSLACLGSRKTRIQIVTDPRLKRNIHKVIVESDSGKIITETQNLPCPDNPRTSYLAVLSALATLKGMLDPVRIGT